MTERGWILSTIPLALLEKAPRMNDLKNDYDFVVWEEYRQNSEQYSDKVKVILTSPVRFTPETFREETLMKMANLKAVCTSSLGVDHLPLTVLRRLGIKVGHVVGITKDLAADHAFCLMMAVGRRLPGVMEAARGYQEGDQLDISKSQHCMGFDIHEATLGVIGMGDIGFEVARRAQGFRMKILYHNRNQRTPEDEQAVNATYYPTLKDMLPNVDFLIVAAPLTDATQNMMSKEQFQMMKPTAFVINIGRGAVIDTDDLVEALRNKVIAGAALDVTNPEPLPDDHPLLHMPNVIVTPHIAVYTARGWDGICGMTAEITRAAMEDKQMPGEYKVASPTTDSSNQ